MEMLIFCFGKLKKGGNFNEKVIGLTSVLRGAVRAGVGWLWRRRKRLCRHDLEGSQTMEFTVADEEISFEMSGVKMYFTKK